MAKIVQICLFLGLLVCVSRGQAILQGLPQFNIFTDNSNECNLNVNGIYINDSIIVNTFFSNNSNNTPSAKPAACNYHNFIMDSMFANDSINYSTAFGQAGDNANLVGGFFTNSDLHNLNGTACVVLPQSQNTSLSQYLCRAIFDVATIYFAAWGVNGNTNFTFNTDPNSLIFVQNAQNTENVTGAGNAIGLNASFPAIMANLLDSCGGNASMISALSSPVTVSSSADLAGNLQGFWLAYTLVKQVANRGLNGTGMYNVIVSNSNNTLFGASNNSSCWPMGMNYSDILPDMNYCANGCDVSFVLQDAMMRVYVMQTSGITTAANVSNNSNNTNGGNTVVAGGNNTNGNQTGIVSSGLFMNMNAVVGLISLLYLILA